MEGEDSEFLVFSGPGLLGTALILENGSITPISFFKELKALSFFTLGNMGMFIVGKSTNPENGIGG